MRAKRISAYLRYEEAWCLYSGGRLIKIPWIDERRILHCMKYTELMFQDIRASLPILGRHKRGIGFLGVVCKLFPCRGLWVENTQRFMGPNISSHWVHTNPSVRLGIIPPSCCTSYLFVVFYVLTTSEDQLLGNRRISMNLMDLMRLMDFAEVE